MAPSAKQVQQLLSTTGAPPTPNAAAHSNLVMLQQKFSDWQRCFWKVPSGMQLIDNYILGNIRSLADAFCLETRSLDQFSEYGKVTIGG